MVVVAQSNGISVTERGVRHFRIKSDGQQLREQRVISLLSLQKNRPAVVSGEKMGGWEELCIHLRYVNNGRPCRWYFLRQSASTEGGINEVKSSWLFLMGAFTSIFVEV